MADLPTRALAAEYYTSAEIFAREQDAIMAKTWQFACHASQLPQPGCYLTLTIADESLICIRGGDGNIRAFYNVCQHRGHRLLQGRGRVKQIVCPYHSFCYALDGRFKTAPNIKVIAAEERAKIHLCEVPTDNFLGFIFVNLDANAVPMDEWFPNVREQLQAYVPNITQLQPLEWVEIPEQCNWKISVENYSECYHCATCHPTFSQGVIEPKSYNIAPQGYCLRHTTRCRPGEAMSYAVDLAANAHAGEYSSWFLYPMFSFQVYPGNMLNTYHWRPQTAGSVVVWRGWYSAGGEESAVVRQLAVQDRNTTVAEDICLVESVQSGMRSRGYRPGPLVVDAKGGVNSEHSIQHLQKWFTSALLN